MDLIPSQRIFISYSSKDEALAQKFYDELSSARHQPFLACENIQPGEKWGDRIDLELKECDYFLVLLSEHSVKSDRVIGEVTRAKERQDKENKPVIIPIRVKLHNPIKYRLGSMVEPYQHLDWDSEEDTDRLVKKIRSIISGFATEFSFNHQIRSIIITFARELNDLANTQSQIVRQKIIQTLKQYRVAENFSLEEFESLDNQELVEQLFRDPRADKEMICRLFILLGQDTTLTPNNRTVLSSRLDNLQKLLQIPAQDLLEISQKELAIESDQENDGVNHAFLVLQVKISKNKSQNKKTRYFISAWFDNTKASTPLPIDVISEEGFTTEDLKQILGQLIKTSRQKLGNQTLAIEVFTSEDCLEDPYDCWRYEFLGDLEQLRQSYSLHLRWEQRWKLSDEYNFHNEWSRKWDQLKTQPLTAQEWVDDFKQLIRQKDTIWLNGCQQKVAQHLSFFLRHGIPIIIWSRCSAAHPSHHQEINTLVGNCSCGLDILEKVKQRRQYAPTDIELNSQNLGHHLSLLWEDPYRPPPWINPENYNIYQITS